MISCYTPQYPNSMPPSGTLVKTASHGDSCDEFIIAFIILNNLFLNIDLQFKRLKSKPNPLIETDKSRLINSVKSI